MKDLFQIDEKSKSFQDDYLKYIEEVSGRHFQLQSGMAFIDSREMDSNPKQSLLKFQDLQIQNWGIFEGELTKIHNEFQRLINLFNEFYNSKLSFNNSNSDLSPREIHYLTTKLIVRIKRMAYVLDPDYTIIKFKNNKSGIKYEMIKAYWINDNGEKVRDITRNVGSLESTTVDFVEKILKSNFRGLIQFQPQDNSKSKYDLMISDGKTNWMVQFKLKDKKSFIRTFVMFELWKLYNEEYVLLN